MNLLLDFVKFDTPKTAAHCRDWVKQAASLKGILLKYAHNKNVVGGALAGGRGHNKSTRSGHSNAIKVNHCEFHVNALSSKKSLVFQQQDKLKMNKWGKLKKSLKLINKMNMKPNFMKCYCNIQFERKRKPMLLALPMIQGLLDKSLRWKLSILHKEISLNRTERFLGITSKI